MAPIAARIAIVLALLILVSNTLLAALAAAVAVVWVLLIRSKRLLVAVSIPLGVGALGVRLLSIANSESYAGAYILWLLVALLLSLGAAWRDARNA